MALVGAFIGIAILLGIGTQILGSAVQSCDQLNDYDSLTTQAAGTWALACEEQNAQTQNAYSLFDCAHCSCSCGNFDSCQITLESIGYDSDFFD